MPSQGQPPFCSRWRSAWWAELCSADSSQIAHSSNIISLKRMTWALWVGVLGWQAAVADELLCSVHAEWLPPCTRSSVRLSHESHLWMGALVSCPGSARPQMAKKLTLWVLQLSRQKWTKREVFWSFTNVNSISSLEIKMSVRNLANVLHNLKISIVLKQQSCLTVLLHRGNKSADERLQNQLICWTQCSGWGETMPRLRQVRWHWEITKIKAAAYRGVP